MTKRNPYRPGDAWRARLRLGQLEADLHVKWRRRAPSKRKPRDA